MVTLSDADHFSRCTSTSGLRPLPFTRLKDPFSAVHHQGLCNRLRSSRTGAYLGQNVSAFQGDAEAEHRILHFRNSHQERCGCIPTVHNADTDDRVFQERYISCKLTFLLALVVDLSDAIVASSPSSTPYICSSQSFQFVFFFQHYIPEL